MELFHSSMTCGFHCNQGCGYCCTIHYFILQSQSCSPFLLYLYCGRRRSSFLISLWESFTSILGDELWERILTKVTSTEQTLTVRSSSKSICFRLFRLQKFCEFARHWSFDGLNFVNVYSFRLFPFLSNSPKRKKEILILGLGRTRFSKKSRSVVVLNFK